MPKHSTDSQQLYLKNKPALQLLKLKLNADILKTMQYLENHYETEQGRAQQWKTGCNECMWISPFHIFSQTVLAAYSSQNSFSLTSHLFPSLFHVFLKSSPRLGIPSHFLWPGQPPSLNSNPSLKLISTIRAFQQ